MKPETVRQAVHAASLIYMMAILTLVGAYVGSQLDKRFETGPWGSLTGTFLGLGIGLWRISRGLIFQKSDDDNEPPHSP